MDVPGLQAATLFASRNMWLAMGQYVCSNFTFYFALSWALPDLKTQFGLTTVMAGVYAAVPLLCGAAGNWVAGAMVDRIYRSGRWQLSRRLPAIVGFLLAAVGLVGLQLVDTPLGYAALLVRGRLRGRHDTQPVLGFLHRHRPPQCRHRLGNDEHGGQPGGVRHAGCLPLLEAVDPDVSGRPRRRAGLDFTHDSLFSGRRRLESVGRVPLAGCTSRASVGGLVMARYRGVCIGAGYFSKFQYEAWNRIPEVEITAMCNRNTATSSGDSGRVRHSSAITPTIARCSSRSGRTSWT